MDGIITWAEGGDGIIANVGAIGVTLVVRVGKSGSRAGVFTIIEEQELTEANAGQALDGEIAENRGGIIEIPTESAGVEVFYIVGVGEFGKLAFATLDGIVQSREGEAKNNSDYGRTNDGQQGNFVPGKRLLGDDLTA